MHIQHNLKTNYFIFLFFCQQQKSVDGRGMGWQSWTNDKKIPERRIEDQTCGEGDGGVERMRC